MFDQVVIVDWSAAAKPKLGPDSIWVARALRSPRPHLAEVVNLSTRAEARDYLETHLRRPEYRSFCGLDFSFGYPLGYGALLRSAFGTSGRTFDVVAEVTSALLRDAPDNANNRFEVAAALNASVGRSLFWGRPGRGPSASLATLSPTRSVPDGLGPNPLEPLRVTERLLGRSIGSNWQLLGVGSVGSQVLTGLPVVAALRAQVSDVAIWPFDSGLELPGARVVLAELWPPLFEQRGSRPPSQVRDEAQVRDAAQALIALDASGWAGLFGPVTALHLDPSTRRRVVEEEGWMFGLR